MNTGQQTFRVKVRAAQMYVGYLAHDNHWFDRVCPRCGLWHSSAEAANCKTCQTPLTYLTGKGGQIMGVSEGKVYPILGKRREKDAAQTRARKNGLMPVYRFKMFAFADSNGLLVPPAAHMHCRKSAVVKITVYNHQAQYSGPFMTKEGPAVEIMLPIFPAFGDKVELIQDAKEIAAYEDAQPTMPAGQLSAEQELAQLKAELARMTGQPVPLPVVQPVPSGDYDTDALNQDMVLEAELVEDDGFLLSEYSEADIAELQADPLVGTDLREAAAAAAVVDPFQNS